MRTKFKFNAMPRYWPTIGLAELSDWIASEAERLKADGDPIMFAEEVEDSVTIAYSDRELAGMLCAWAYNYALAQAEGVEDEG